MKRALWTLLPFLIITPAMAYEVPKGFYASAQVMNNQFDPDELARTNQFGFGVGVGYQWLNWLAFELRAEKGFGSNYGSNYDGFDDAYEVDVDYKFSALTKFEYRFNSGWTPYAVLGATSTKNHQAGFPYRSTNFSYGAGITYPFKVKGGVIDVGAEYLFVIDDDDSNPLNDMGFTNQTLGYTLNAFGLVINYRY